MAKVHRCSAWPRFKGVLLGQGLKVVSLVNIDCCSALPRLIGLV